MNLLAIIIVLLAIATAGAIAYIAWELSSGEPVFTRSGKGGSRKPAGDTERPDA